MNMTLKQRVDAALNGYSNLKATTGPSEPVMALIEWHKADEIKILGMHLPPGVYMGDALAQAIKALTQTEGKPEAIVFSADIWTRAFPADTDPESIDFQPGDWGKQLDAGDMTVGEALHTIGVTPIEEMAVERRYTIDDAGRVVFKDAKRVVDADGPVYATLREAVR